MDENFWNELATVFAEVIELPPEERPQFLAIACEGNPALRKEIDSLLGYYESAPEFLDDVSSVMDFKTKIRDRGGGVDHFKLIGSRVSRYEVVDMIGAGGMGMVYKAIDHELRRTIALKFLSPSLSSNGEARERFTREARAASALDHPNVCTVYEVGRSDSGLIFIAMAYYEGQTLKDVLKNGPLDEEKVLKYSTHIAQGLAAAHSKGIIHRDIKPANIMVTEDDRVKILDFGLAKTADQNLTRQGATMGTVAYMSPEQIRGDQVDLRTDVWSLGVLLYQLAEGTLPFKGDYEQAIMYSVLNDDPRDLTHHSIPGASALKGIIDRCLKKDREDRYSSMSDIVHDLEVLAGERTHSGSFLFKTGHQPRGPLQRLQATFQQHPWIPIAFVGGSLMLLILMLAPAMVNVQGNSGQNSNVDHVAVLPFQVSPDSQDNQAFASGLSYVLADLLVDLTGEDESMWIVPASEIQRYQVKSSREARDIFGVDKVLSGSMLSTEDIIALSLELIDPQTLGLIDAERRQTTREEIRNVLDQGFQDILLDGLINLFGLQLKEDTRDALMKKLPENEDAYQYYIQGIGYIHQYDNLENVEKAIGFFEKSLAEDSLFALAHSGLCQAYWEKSVRTTDASFSRRAIERCNKASVLGDSIPEVMAAVGVAYFETGQYDAAKTQLISALALNPDDANAHRWLGRVYEQQSQPDSAETSYLKAIALEPGSWIFHDEIGLFYTYSGENEKALEHYNTIKELTPDNYIAYNGLAVAERNLENIDAAKELFETSIEKLPNAIAYRNLGRLYYLDGRFDEAVAQYRSALELEASDRSYLTSSFLAHAMYWSGDREGARASWASIVDQVMPFLETNPDNEDLLVIMADALVAMGDEVEAAPYLERLEQLPLSANYIPYYLGRVFAAMGNNEKALEYFGDALNKGFSPYQITKDPALEALRQQSAYESFKNSYGF